MKVLLKWVVRLSVVVAVVAGGYYLYKKYNFTPQQRALNVAPRDAVFILESKEPIESWQDVSASNIWRHLQKHPFFAEAGANAAFLDSLISDNKQLFSMFGSRYVTLSVHKTSARDFDFLYLVDMEETNVRLVQEAVKPVLKHINPNISISEYHGYEILQVYDPEYKATLYLTFIDNLMAASYTSKLIYNTIKEKEIRTLEENETFQKLRQLVDADEMFNVYVQYAFLDDYLAIFSSGEQDMLRDLAEAVSFSGFDVQVREDLVRAHGYSFLTDSGQTFLHALRETGAAARHAHDFATDRTAIYAALLSDNYTLVYDKFIEQLKSNPANYKEYEENTRKVEKLLAIELKRDFISWIGDEVALLTVKPKDGSAQQERILAIRSNNLSDAKERLDFVMKQIKRRSPIKFKEKNYKEYTIHWMKVKGFFNLLFGKLFKQFDKPYFTYIEDYVVFANSEQVLIDLIDDYEAGRTMRADDAYADFESKFSNMSNIFLYVNTQNFHPLISNYLQGKSLSDFEKNKNYFLSFKHIGLSLTARENYYESDLRIQYMPYEPKTPPTDDTKRPDSTAVDTSNAVTPIFETYADGDPKIEAFKRNDKWHGEYASYYRNRNREEQGTYTDGIKTGTWYFYKRDGALERKEYYDSQGNLIKTEDH